MASASPSLMPLVAERSPWLRGPIRLPGDPQMSWLALLLASLARGESVIENLNTGAETLAVAAALRQLGPRLEAHGPRWHVQGIGVGGYLTPQAPIDLSAAGAAAPLLIGSLAANGFAAEFTGLVPSPMTGALLDFLRRNGTRVEVEGDRLVVAAPRFGVPLDLALSAEAQGLIAPLLLHALQTAGRSSLLLAPGATDPVVGLLETFGAKIAVDSGADGTRVGLDGLSPLRAQAFTVPGDPALAAFPAVAALIAPDSEITMTRVALHSSGFALLDALALLGGDFSFGEARGGAADIVVRHAPLVGTTIPADLGVAPDDYAVLTIAAAFAEGETVLEGLGEGTRRLALTRALRANRIECVELRGGLMVRGSKRIAGGGSVIVRLDPKLAMAFLILGMAADQPVAIDDGAVMAELFPDFTTAFEHVGASFSVGSPA